MKKDKLQKVAWNIFKKPVVKPPKFKLGTGTTAALGTGVLLGSIGMKKAKEVNETQQPATFIQQF